MRGQAFGASGRSEGLVSKFTRGPAPKPRRALRPELCAGQLNLSYDDRPASKGLKAYGNAGTLAARKQNVFGVIFDTIVQGPVTPYHE